MNKIPVDPAILDKTLRFVELSSALTKRALDENDIHRQAQKQAGDLRPKLLQHMIDSGVVAATQKDAADAMLASHSGALQLLKSAVDKINGLKKEAKASTKSAGDLGAPDGPAPTKTANEYNSLESPFLGRRTSQLKESDKALMRAVGGR